MKRIREPRTILALLFIFAGLLAFSPAPGGAAEKPALTQADCVKCHEAPPADIAAAGGKHKTDVTCMDCHAGHRPAVKNNIPKCSACHDGKPHYQMKDCLECHKNPHKPLNIVLAGKMTEPCLTCHADQIKQLKANPSRHTALFCTNCHDVHRKIPECVKCHKPHSAEMTQADCKKCHKAHKPKAVTYAADVPNKDCGSCHKNAFKLLSATQTKHRNVACVKCHAEKHKAMPTCEQCHPKKHPASIVSKFPECGTCHSIAHDLNHWGTGEAPAPAKAAPAKKKSRK